MCKENLRLLSVANQVDQQCPNCGRWTTDERLVVNWGVCDVCLDESYSAYLAEPRTVARDAVEEQGIGE